MSLIDSEQLKAWLEEKQNEDYLIFTSTDDPKQEFRDGYINCLHDVLEKIAELEQKQKSENSCGECCGTGKTDCANCDGTGEIT